MTIKKPFYRNCRQFSDGSYANSGKADYIDDSRYAKNRENYVRAFLLIQKDLLNLFNYIEPADLNLKCYSFRVHELLVRTCIEVEANLKAILRENGYPVRQSKTGRGISWNMHTDYPKIEKSHLLSRYQILLPFWKGDAKNKIRTPFASFSSNKKPSPVWYTAYNTTKHDRNDEFENANLENLIDAICGLLVILSSQFHTKDFSSGPTLLELETGIDDGFECGIGSYFKVKFPDFPGKIKYSFGYEEWLALQKSENPFEKFDYLSAAEVI